MSLENLSQYFDFTNVSNIINMVFVAALGFLTFKQRAELIIAKFKRKELTMEIEHRDAVSQAMAEELAFLGDTMVAIVQASKLDNSDKINIVTKWSRVKENVNATVIGNFVQKAADIKENVEDTVKLGKDVISMATDILGNVKSNQ
jgi:hypothetical protein